MKIKKGSVIVYVLALMLVTAGYWNYISNESKTLETVSMGQNDTEKQNETDEQDRSDETLGDARLVNNNEVTTTVETEKDDYFQGAKLSRDTMYSQTLETYQGILNNSNVSEEQKTIVTQEISKLNKEKNAILICENLLSTKGFTNCVIFVNSESISVIIEAKELKTDEIAQIQNIISRELDAKIENIHIMTK